MKPRKSALACVIILALALPSSAVAGDPEYLPTYLDRDDPLLIDIEESLDYRFKDPGRFSFDGDMRGGYFNTEVDARDGSSENSDEFTVRLRYGANYSFSEAFRVRARLAATCTDSDCDPSLELARTPSRGSNIDDGEVVVDEFYLGYESGLLGLALGRQQTRSLTRGGVFATALTRLTSPNMSVNWTDGLSLRYWSERGWVSKFIAQYNDEDGSSTLTRPPLDFEDGDSRMSWFYSLESAVPWGPITQRGFDVTYMPSALLADGSRDGDIEDYWNFVGRVSSQWPLDAGASSFIMAGQIGYAPETPNKTAIGTGAGGDTGGWAWQVEASWMNFLPGHSIGVNYGVTEPGWLLSASYRPNEDTLVFRYHWRPVPRAQIEIQGRWREDRDQLVGSVRKRDTFDYRLRMSWAFESL